MICLKLPEVAVNGVCNHANLIEETKTRESSANLVIIFLLPAAKPNSFGKKSFAHFRDDRKFGVDQVRDLVLDSLAHDQAGAALVKAVVGHQPAHEFGSRVLKCFVQGA